MYGIVGRGRLRANCRGGCNVTRGSIHSLLTSSSNGLCIKCVTNLTIFSPKRSTVARMCAAQSKLYDGFVNYVARSTSKRV